jgi:hypothetical protein
MCPSIDTDDEVFEVLKRHAEPFVDTPNTVLRRPLGIDQAESRPASTPGKAGKKAERAAPGTLLPESEYEMLDPPAAERTAERLEGDVAELVPVLATLRARQNQIIAELLDRISRAR